MHFLKHIIFVFILISSVSCNSQFCLNLNENFTTYKQAIQCIRATKFTFFDKCNTSKSSWILKAEFYSCYNKKGYFIMQTNNSTYIHKDMPKKLWYEFKNANSFGRFYNYNIKSKYKLILLK